MLKRINDKLALLGTGAFSSMPAFWLFFVWGLLGVTPWVPQHFRDLVLLVSSAWIQLWALPLIAVGSALRNKASDDRAIQDHQLLMRELVVLKHNQRAHDTTLIQLAVLREEVAALRSDVSKAISHESVSTPS